MIEASISVAKPARDAVRVTDDSAAPAQDAGDTTVGEQFAALLMLLASGMPVPGATAPMSPVNIVGADGKPLPTDGQALPLAGAVTTAVSPSGQGSPDDTDAIDAAFLEFFDDARMTGTVASQAHRLLTLDPGFGGASRSADLLGVVAGAIESAQARTDASMLPQVLTAAATPAPTDARAAMFQAVPLSGQPLTPGTPDFDPALGERVLWMVQQGLQSARVRVHPEHLGPIDIRLKLDGDAAQITLVAAHGVARDALEQALPRLRDMLGDAGVTLTQADISDRGAGANDRRAPLTNDMPMSDDGIAVEGTSPGVVHRLITPAGLVDRFA